MSEFLTVLGQQQPRKLFWFEFLQNNSGGYYREDEDVCELVYVQAHTAKEAVEKAKQFCDNDNSCECCGDRWSFRINDMDGWDVPMLYGKPLETSPSNYFLKKAKLHKFDGTVVTFVLGDGKRAGCIEEVKNAEDT